MTSVAVQLTKDHEELQALLHCLAQDAKAPLPGALQATWVSFETQLLRHMDAEERLLLPLLAASDAAEVARIRAEHARIRDLLNELGVAVELHTVREANISELIALLEAHAKHENAQLYRLASAQASEALEGRVARLLERGVAVTAAAVSNRLAERKSSSRRARP